MANNRLLINVDEFAKELAELPGGLAALSEPIVHEHADSAVDRVKSAYPRGETGNLQAGVKKIVEKGSDKAIKEVLVVSSAPHAHLYEYGTSSVTGSGARPHSTFKPITDEEIRSMVGDVSNLVRDQGFAVSGDVD